MIFEDIELEWEGLPYKIKGDDNIMRVLGAVEEHITFMELQRGMSTGKVPIAKLSTAYSVILRFAGCKVSSAEVYQGMWKDLATAQKIQEATVGILAIMVPPGVAEEYEDDGEPDNKPKSKKKPSAGSQ